MVPFEDLVCQFCVHECVSSILHFVINFSDFEVGFGIFAIESQGQLIGLGGLFVTSPKQIPVIGEIK